MSDINEIKTFAVIGAGTMGREIAQVALMAGFQRVVLNDLRMEIINDGADYIFDGLKKLELKGDLKKGFTANGLMEKLERELGLKNAVKEADFVVEAIPEVMRLKQDLFRKLGEFTPTHAILATNTSTMSITEIASKSGRPDKVIGMHFFIPIPLLRLIELIRGEKTSNETVTITIQVGKQLPALKGKRILPVIEKESPGFIVNRLNISMNVYLNWLLDEAVKNGIPCGQIDADVTSFQSMGPYAKWDYIGLETIYNTHKYFEKVISPDFAPGKTLTKLVKEGNLGRKTGKGLYQWIERKPIVDTTKKAGLFNFDLFFALQLNEGCRLLEEGIVSGYKIIDDTMLAGMDMPGPFAAGKRNYKKWTKLLDDFVEKSGKDYFKPCELMKSGGFLKMRK